MLSRLGRILGFALSVLNGAGQGIGLFASRFDAHRGFVHDSATTEEARARLWEARHKVYFAGLAIEDCVARSKAEWTRVAR